MSGLAVPKPLEAHPAISQWIGFRDGVVEVRTGRVELGQGNGTALMQIVADELDVEMDQLVLVSGDTRASPDEGFTSGSFSVQLGGLALRYAASAARALLLEEAAKLLQSEPAMLAVERGSVRIAERETDLSWWTLAPAVPLERPVMASAAPKAAGERRLAGQPVPRADLVAKMLGGGFIHDLAPEGMIHGRVLHPPSMSQRLVSLDVERLEAVPGVDAVLRDGSLVGVLAAREEHAVRALEVAERIACWSEPEEVTTNPLGYLDRAAGPPETTYRRGEAVGDGLRVATRVSRGFVAHASIGPSCAIATWRGGRLEVISHTQGPHNLARALADAFGLDADDVSVRHAPGAGCYGHNGADDVAFDAAFLARAAPGRPVRVVWSRADELAAGPLGAAASCEAAAFVGRDGAIGAFEIAITSFPFGMRPGRGGAPNFLSATLLETPRAFSAPGDLPLAEDGTAGGADRNAVPLYEIPAVRVQKSIAVGAPFRSSSLRSLGAHLNVFAVETLMDDVAFAIGRDPVELRLAHLSDPRARHVVERTAALAGWRPGAEDGMGIGFARYKLSGAYCAVAVHVAVEEEVRVTRAFAVVDAGECVNPNGARNQIEGGIVQSISWTLKEAVPFDGAVPVARDWDAYPIVRFSEVPTIETEIVHRPDAPPLGLAEAAAGPTAAAIGNAVFRALGVRVRDLPLTREAIVAAMDLAEEP